eukprot:3285276-Alexandrium_andersonii.AAC.1
MCIRDSPGEERRKPQKPVDNNCFLQLFAVFCAVAHMLLHKYSGPSDVQKRRWQALFGGQSPRSHGGEGVGVGGGAAALTAEAASGYSSICCCCPGEGPQARPLRQEHSDNSARGLLKPLWAL